MELSTDRLRPMWRHMAFDTVISIVLCQALTETNIEVVLISRLLGQYEQTSIKFKSKYNVFLK